MTMIRFRLIGSRDNADNVIAGLHSMEDIERIEEIDDLMPELRDDSSSSESAIDNPAHTYYVEVEAPNDERADDVRGRAEVLAHTCQAGIEFVDRF